MMQMITRIAVAAALAGAGTAHATDWDKLNSGWSAGAGAEAQAGASASTGSDTVASVDASADWGAEIATAFQSLGMATARAECYGRMLTKQLSPDEQEKAATIVRTASNGEEVRSAVLDAGPAFVGGFSAADAACPKG